MVQYVNKLRFKGWSGKDLPLRKSSPYMEHADGFYPTCLVVRPAEDNSMTLLARIGINDNPTCMGLEREIEIPNQVTVAKLRRIGNNPDVVALCLRMLAGYSKEWDGRNHYGNWLADAEDAFDMLKQIVTGIIK